jgi:hypothetical protein
MHGWYEVVSFLDHDNERKFACWLGPAEDYGGGDAAFFIPKSATPIVRSTFWSLSLEERADRRDEIEEFLRSIEDKIGDKRSNEEVIEELGDGQLPLIETIGNGMTCPTTESA